MSLLTILVAMSLAHTKAEFYVEECEAPALPPAEFTNIQLDSKLGNVITSQQIRGVTNVINNNRTVRGESGHRWPWLTVESRFSQLRAQRSATELSTIPLSSPSLHKSMQFNKGLTEQEIESGISAWKNAVYHPLRHHFSPSLIIKQRSQFREYLKTKSV